MLCDVNVAIMCSYKARSCTLLVVPEPNLYLKVLCYFVNLFADRILGSLNEVVENEFKSECDSLI